MVTTGIWMIDMIDFVSTTSKWLKPDVYQ